MAVVKLYIRFQEKKNEKTSSHFLKRNKKCVHLVSIEIKMVDGERWEVYDKWREWDETFGKGHGMANKMRMEKTAKEGGKYVRALYSSPRREMSKECVVGKRWVNEKMSTCVRERKDEQVKINAWKDELVNVTK